MFDPNFSQPYNAIRSQYDATYDSPTQGFYNQLKGSIYEFKSTNYLPNNMYNSLNNMQDNYGNSLGSLGGLEKKI